MSDLPGFQPRTLPFRMQIHHGLFSLAVLDDAMQNADALAATPFQSAPWIRAYLSQVEPDAEFCLVDLESAGARLLLPLVISAFGPLRVADIPGSKHASFHAPVIVDAGVAFRVEPLRQAMTMAGKALKLDAFILRDGPETVAGHPNPLLALPCQPSPNSVAMLTLGADAEAVMAQLTEKDDRKKRQKRRQKERKLSEFGDLHARWAQSEEERAAALLALHRWKSDRFHAQGIQDPFESDAMARFLRLASAGDAPALRLFTLWVGTRLIAVMLGATDGRHFSGMANAHDPDPEISRSSPGEVLLMHLLPALCHEGFTGFDLGAGEARYKAQFCPEIIALRDCTLAISFRGRIGARMFLILRAIKRQIKQSPAAMSMLGRMRRLRSR